MNEHTIQIRTAIPFSGECPFAFEVCIGPSVPGKDDSALTSEGMAQLVAIYKTDAAALEDILHRSRPGGTYDHLLIRLLERTASRLKVRHRA